MLLFLLSLIRLKIMQTTVICCEWAGDSVITICCVSKWIVRMRGKLQHHKYAMIRMAYETLLNKWILYIVALHEIYHNEQLQRTTKIKKKKKSSFHRRQCMASILFYKHTRLFFFFLSYYQYSITYLTQSYIIRCVCTMHKQTI